ncbi:MAG: tRNA (guanosine(37)-N1)-methyltransferase TrmD [Candidatus Dasytiphilus stammeri]
MWIGVISLFPQMFKAITDYGITSRAIKNGLLSIQYWNPRDFTLNKHKTVDDRPYGGGFGMLMMVQPLRDAINVAKKSAGNLVKVIYLSPQGRKLDQKGVNELANSDKIIFVCGRYEGIDERIINMEIDEEWSVGDYIVSGGELPAMILIDAITRFIPGAVGKNLRGVEEDSFFKGLLEHPHFTRPKVLDGKSIPTVLLSGNHYEIRRWRIKQSLGRTWLRRPDLLKINYLNKEQIDLLTEFKKEYFNQTKKNSSI